MNIYNSSDDLYEMQEAWNTLDERECLFMTQYDLSDALPEYTSTEWSDFLSDGKVAKYIDKQIGTFKKAQMRKLIDKSTENDKSVGTAQMLNAIGKTLEDDDQEAGFFVYSYVPLRPQECEADNVQLEDEWKAPVIIQDMDDTVIPIQKDKPKVSDTQKAKPKSDINVEDFF